MYKNDPILTWSYAVQAKSQPQLLKAHYRIFCDCWYVTIHLTGSHTGKSSRRSQHCIWERISNRKERTAHVFSRISFSRCRLWRVSQHCSRCFICLFVLLLVPKCTPADNPWQWQIRGGFFKVAAPVSAQRSLCFSFLPSHGDRDDEWGSEVSHCLSEPDTTRL